MKKTFITKMSMLLASLLLSALLLPVAAYAAVSFSLYFNPGTGKLSGYIYLTDPEHVKVYPKKGSTVTDITYFLNTSKYKHFDGNNSVVHSVYFHNVAIGEAPDSITVKDGDQEYSVNAVQRSNGTLGYMGGGTLDMGVYRMPATHSFQNVTASTYLPAGSNLFTFTPTTVPIDDGFEDLPLTGIEISFPYTADSKTSLQLQNIAVSDFVIRDLTVQQDVYVEGLIRPKSYIQVNGQWGYHYDEITYKLQIVPQTALIKDHQYSLNLSATAGNEIMMPAGGTEYRALVEVGEMMSYRYSLTGELVTNVIGYNIKTFSDITIGASPATTPIYGGGPYIPTQTSALKKNGDSLVLADDAQTLSVETSADGSKYVKVAIDADKLAKAFDELKAGAKSSKVLVLELDPKESSVQVNLPASALSDAIQKSPDAVVSVKTKQSSYDLPIKLLDIQKLAASLGNDIKNVIIQIHMNVLKDNAADKYAAQTKNLGVEVIGNIIDFSVSAEAGGKKVEVSDFGSSYVTRSITVNQSVYAEESTAVMFDHTTGQAVFVPSLFHAVNGQTTVLIKRNGNSTYAVVKGNKAFEDMNGHWAKQDVEMLASKLVVDGVEKGTFAPSASVTRGEFAALVSKGLGLTQDAKNADRFTDIKESDWYAGYIGAASKAGIVDGFEDVTFRPQNQITREEMAVILAKAYAFTGKAIELVGNNATYISTFKDSEQISEWAQQSVAKTIRAELMNGVESGLFVPKAQATRAEAAVVLKRMLQAAEFID
jgi:hypothetical protein